MPRPFQLHFLLKSSQDGPLQPVYLCNEALDTLIEHVVLSFKGLIHSIQRYLLAPPQNINSPPIRSLG